MDMSEIILIGYYIADRFGRGEVDNQSMADFAARIEGIGALDTGTFSRNRRYQKPLRSGDRDNPKFIVSVSEQTGTQRAIHGAWRITPAGRERAEQLLTGLLD